MTTDLCPNPTQEATLNLDTDSEAWSQESTLALIEKSNLNIYTKIRL